MAESIYNSQKVLLVLSQEFVRSRWCLLEANMSLFRDCLERKPVIPVLLEPETCTPLHLCHLTYLDAHDPDFLEKLLKVLCTPNRELRSSTVAPFQPPSVYSGKALLNLDAVNQEGLHRWQAGVFSEHGIPDQLHLVLQDREKYAEAVRIVNSVSQSKGWFHSVWMRGIIWSFMIAIIFLYFAVVMVLYSYIHIEHREMVFIHYVPLLGVILNIILWETGAKKKITREMQKSACKANIILHHENVLMGCVSSTKLCFVYVSLEGCRRSFDGAFDDPEVAREPGGSREP
ncbi:uncharacterized protein LOC114788200 isoform X2 [Denticeps clupeoides]|uniref:uncharacterized protein LOC114788200 isoform X2 n=1 Tax=Denticeps clupeoides TaxID=299321 RepID=UPI0010A329D3|nr:uncharacterized protein LOC114788200 isoform X2 [Denticeps clupeoides]XP_028832366.1 uncharacterized protein LOC114788200 isoform X2 [Denticeps clupeoides]